MYTGATLDSSGQFYSLQYEILRDDSPLDKKDFRLKNMQIRQTVSWKIACILAPHSTLAVNFILSSMNL